MGICDKEKRITELEFNQIVIPLVKSNDQFKKENKKLKRQLAQFQRMCQQNLNNNGFNTPQNYLGMNIIGGGNNNQYNNNRITFVFQNGSQYIIFLEDIKTTTEALEELRIQKPNLPNIKQLVFIYNCNNITQYFTKDFEIRPLGLNTPILVIINEK